MIKWIKKFIRSLNLILIGLTLISYFSPEVSPKSVWIMPFFSYALPIFLILNFVVMIFLYTIKHKSYWLNLGVLILSFFFLGDLMVLGGSSDTKNQPNAIKVMTFNALGFKKNVKSGNNLASFEKAFKPYANLLKEQKPSIICFQEAANRFDRTGLMEQYLKSEIGLDYYYFGEPSVRIYSKYPIINKGVVVGKSTNSSTFVDIKKDEAIIRVYNLHLKSTGIAPEAEKVIDNPDMEDKATKQQVKNIIVLLKRANDKRASQVDAIRKHMDASPYPIIVCGDFNDVPFSYSYRQIRKGLQDSFIKRGDGIGETYNGAIPLLRIDYIMASMDFDIHSHEVIHSDLSDHFPVISEIELK